MFILKVSKVWWSIKCYGKNQYLSVIQHTITVDVVLDAS